MAINNPSFSASDVTTDVQLLRLEMMPSGPPALGATAAPIDPPLGENRMFGWYNGSSDMVELYITNSAGNKYLRVSTYRD